jgi:hypothetical protein
MTSIQNYVPILRWKQAERDALAKIAPTVRESITPLFELIMPAPKREKGDYKTVLADSKTVLTARLEKTIEDINKCCFQGAAFIDVHLIDGDVRAQTLKKILDSASNANPTLIPVTHIIPVLSTEADTLTRSLATDYARSSGNGLCIRIDRFNLGDSNLAEVINNFVSANNLQIENTDLLIDLGVIGAMDKVDIVAEQLSKLPHLDKWRSFIVSGGAFPKDLSEFEKHSQQQVPRLDWRLWSDLNTQTSLIRKPTYSDYTIQHPIYFGHIEGMINTSASIRYADVNLWEVSRGEGLQNKDGAGHMQYPALAQLLVGQSFFKGADYSFGDSYIADRAKPDNKNTGNPTTWLKAGINHHITLVVQERAKLA